MAQPQNGAPLPAAGATAAAAAPAGGQKAATMTALQLEVLEASFLLNSHPSEEHRRTLGGRIGLAPKDVMNWFTNRRRKEKRKEKAAEKAAAAAAAAPAAAPAQQQAAASAQQAGSSRAATPPAAAAQTSSAPGSPWTVPPSTALPPRPPSLLGAQQQQRVVTGLAPAGIGGVAGQQATDDESAQEGATANGAAEEAYATLSRRLDSYKPLLEAAKATLPVPFREDGPPLGFEFDPVPLPAPNEGATTDGGEPTAKRRRIVLDDMVAEAGEDGITGFKKHQPSGGGRGSGGSGFGAGLMGGFGSTSEFEAQVEAQHAAEVARSEAARAEAEAKLARETERVVNTQRMLAAAAGQEAERLRQQLMRQQEQLARARAREEEERKRDAERLDMGRRRQLEKLSKERHKEDVKRTRELEKLRQAQEREMKKLEAKRERERKAEERKKAAEDKKRDKEMARALAQQERTGLRIRHREGASGPPDDLDLEWDKLTEAARATAGYASDTEGNNRASPAPVHIVRPQFPPSALALEPAFPPELGSSAGADLLAAWAFCHSFRDVLGLPAFSVDALLAAVGHGSTSALLGVVHMAMLRVVQADMEDAHASGALQAGGTMNFLDRALITHATLLEEAWAWGFDVDAWRAHLGPLTWPEVMRQLALAHGAGPKRPKVKRDVRDKLGAEGEDVVGVEGRSLKLRLPARFGAGTAKAAAWQVLSRVDHRGLSIAEIARLIQRKGLRDLSGSKTPEASLANALSRDVLFCRVKPGTYALQAVVSHNAAMEARDGGCGRAGTPVPGSGKGKGLTANGGDASPEAAAGAAAAGAGAGAAPMQVEGRFEAGNGIKQEKPALEQPGALVKAEAADAASPSPMDVDSSTPKQEPGSETAALTPAAKQERQQEGQTPGSGGGRGNGDSSVEVMEGEAGVAGEAGAAEREEDGFSEEEAEDSDDEEEGAQQEGEAWVAGLLTSGYDALPLPERITALSWLCQATCESITIRACLEKRGEESQRLRRQLFDEARAEKKRRQDEQAARTAAATAEAQKKLQELQRRMIEGEAISPEELAAAAAGAAGDLPGHGKAEGVEAQKEAEEDAVAERTRRTARADAIARIEETNCLRVEPLGSDRRHNRYWRFANGAAGDPGAGRVWVEFAGQEACQGSQQQQQQQGERSEQQGQQAEEQQQLQQQAGGTSDGMQTGSWRLLLRPEQLETLRGALEPKGAREGVLFASLVRHEAAIKAAMPGAALQMGAHAGLPEEEASAWLRSGARQASSSTHLAPGELQQHGPASAVVQLIADMLGVAQRVEEGGFAQGFDRHQWAQAVQAAPDLPSLRRCLGELESAILPPHLSPAFPLAPNLVRRAWLPGQQKPGPGTPGADASTAGVASSSTPPAQQQQQHASTPQQQQQQQQHASEEALAWLPATAAALALRLYALSACLLPSSGSAAAREALAGYHYTLRPVPLPPPPSVEELAASAQAREQHQQQQQQEQEAGRSSLLQQLLRCRVMYGPPVVANGRQRLLMFPPFADHVLARPSTPFQLPLSDLRAAVQAALADGSFHAAPAPPPPPPRTSGAKRGGLTLRGARGGGRGSRGGRGGRGGKQKAAQDAGSDDDWERNRDERPVTPPVNRGAPVVAEWQDGDSADWEGGSDIDDGAKDDADDPDFR